uniref:Putative secreted peptide n=1 Tax=Anopheles braziliensis TaxID=58242 RepID=A0A2M3ZRE2_9DIPT
MVVIIIIVHQALLLLLLFIRTAIDDHDFLDTAAASATAATATAATTPHVCRLECHDLWFRNDRYSITVLLDERCCRQFAACLWCTSTTRCATPRHHRRSLLQRRCHSNASNGTGSRCGCCCRCLLLLSLEQKFLNSLLLELVNGCRTLVATCSIVPHR